MIQFNLLPDIKIQYLKAKRQKHIVILISVVATTVSLAVFILLLTTVFVLQKKNVSDLNKDIKTSSSQLQGIQDLNKILTVQNQLGTLTSLHDKKVVSSRLLGYLTQVTPASTSVSKLVADYSLNTLSIGGNADSLALVNTYTDTLKFTKYTTTDSSAEKTAFSNVQLKTFNRDSKTATYEISVKFDPAIFSNAKQVTLKVPKIITTRSETAKPAEVFQGAR
jgi:hypothetical protein